MLLLEQMQRDLQSLQRRKLGTTEVLPTRAQRRWERKENRHTGKSKFSPQSSSVVAHGILMSQRTASESWHFAVGTAHWDFRTIMITLLPLLVMHCHSPSALPTRQGSVSQYQISPMFHLLSRVQSGHKVLPPILTIKLSLLRHLWETACLWWQETAGASPFTHWCLIHTLMWIKKGPNCKHRSKCTWLTVGFALPPPLTLSEPDKLLPSLFSAPRDGCLFCVCTSCSGSQQAANTQEYNSNTAEKSQQKRICGPSAYVCGEFTAWA